MKKILLLPFFFFALTSLAQTKLTIQSKTEKCADVETANRNHVYGDFGFYGGVFENADSTFPLYVVFFNLICHLFRKVRL